MFILTNSLNITKGAHGKQGMVSVSSKDQYIAEECERGRKNYSPFELYILLNIF